MEVTSEAYRTADESGSSEAAGTVAWNWISALAQEQRDTGMVATEIVSEPIEGGGRVTRLYRGTTLLAVATTFRDAMNFTVFTRWVAPELQPTAEAEAAELRAEVERYAQALVNHNEVLRSAYQIAARKGRSTEWDGFTQRAGSVLHFHHDEVEAARTALAGPSQ